MARRLSGLALALVITGAPLAPVVCAVTCASHDLPSLASRSEHHSCHEPSSTGATAIPVPHACGHDGDGSIAAQELIQILNTVGVAELPIIAPVSFDREVAPIHATHIQHSPPGLPALTTPLRV